MRKKVITRLWAIAIALAVLLPLQSCNGILGFKTFEVVSSNMEPTYSVGDVVWSDRVAIDELKRGDVIFAYHDSMFWMARLAALPGDTIAMLDGQVVLNGELVLQKRLREYVIQNEPIGPRRMTLLEEQFPGEDSPHEILDGGVRGLDNTPLVTLKQDEFFLLGDNRDNSADSRIPVRKFGGGLGVVRSDQILWRARRD